MTSTTFIDKTTLIEAPWLNDVDALVYQGQLDDGTTGASISRYLPAGTGAVATTVDAELKNSVYVTDFGAVVSDRSTLPSLAVQQANADAFNAAILHLMLLGGGELFVPNGVFHVYGTIELNLDSYTPAFSGGNVRPIIRITGIGGATIYQNHPTAPLIRAVVARIRILNLVLCGRGSMTTGNLIELYYSQYWQLDTLLIQGSAGRGLLIVNSERGLGKDLIFYSLRQAIVYGTGATNETYFYNTSAISIGTTRDYLLGGSIQDFSTNPPGTAGTYAQIHRAAIDISNCVNNRFVGGSVKSTMSCAGFRCRGTEISGIHQFYFEGFVTGAINPSIILGNYSEATTISAGITAGDVTIPVTDASWFLPVVSNAAGGAWAESGKYVIYDPADLATFEIVSVKYFLDNVAYTVVRAQDGTTARAWSSGVVFRESLINTGIGDFSVNDCHLESYANLPGSSTLAQDVALGQTAGEIILGNMWDEFHRSITQVPVNLYTLVVSNNRARVYNGPNSGKIQTWGTGGLVNIVSKEPGTVPRGFVGIVSSDSVVASPTVSVYTFQSGSAYYRNINSNSVPSSYEFDINDSVNYGGSGQTYVLHGENGLAISRTSLKTSDIAGFSATTYTGFKYMYSLDSGASWITSAGMTRDGFKTIGGTMRGGTTPPEGSAVGYPGDIFLYYVNAAGTKLYVKESGFGTNTGWVGK